MTLRLYREKNFGADALERIRQVNEIIADYESQGFRLTLRQAYYQLVSRDVIPNTERSYKSLGTLISDARLAGLMSWDAIEDRVRVARAPQQFDDLNDLVHAALQSYRLPRWAGQENYVELWVEKDALAGVLEPIAREYHITLMVNRGYSSQSAMYESAQRFIQNEPPGQSILLYLGDHDPSGEDMVRDVQDRLDMFDAHVEVRKVALTMAQVEEYDPPPNPAKVTDSRAKAYIEKHGDSSWEVDALPPKTLRQVIEDELLQFVDLERVEKVKIQEEKDKKKLKLAVKKL